MIIRRLYIFTLLLLSLSFCRLDPFLALSLSSDHKLTIAGTGVFSQPLKIANLIFCNSTASPSEAIFCDYQFIQRPLSVPFVSLDAARGVSLDLVWLFDSIAVLGAFAFYGIDLDENSKFVTGAFYDYAGPVVDFGSGTETTMIARPILQSGSSCTVLLSLFERSRGDGLLASAKFIMVYLGNEASLRSPSTSLLGHGSEFKRIRNEIIPLIDNEFIGMVIVNKFVYNLYGTVFGGFLMKAAYEAGLKMLGAGVLLEKGVFLRAIEGDVLQVALKIRKGSSTSEFVVTIENDGVLYCAFLLKCNRGEC